MRILHESNCLRILALCETNLDHLIDCGDFSVTDYFPLIRKDSVTHMRGPSAFLNEGLPFAQDLSLEDSQGSYLRFRIFMLYFIWCLLLFPLSINFFIFP